MFCVLLALVFLSACLVSPCLSRSLSVESLVLCLVCLSLVCSLFLVLGLAGRWSLGHLVALSLLNLSSCLSCLVVRLSFLSCLVFACAVFVLSCLGPLFPSVISGSCFLCYLVLSWVLSCLVLGGGGGVGVIERKSSVDCAVIGRQVSVAGTTP